MIKMVDLQAQYSDLRDKVDCAVADVMIGGSFINGTDVHAFEVELAGYVGARHCIGCASGTDAIILALMAVGLCPGDEVIIPSFSFVSAAEAVVLLGGHPVFADVNPVTFNIDCESVVRLITSRTKAIIPTHLFGQPCDMERIMEIADRYRLVVIEDNAQSLGARFVFSDKSSRYAGTIGLVGCTSFFPSKVLGCFGDGGALFTDDPELAHKIKSLANHGQGVKYHHHYVGLNSRLDTLQAAVLRVKLPLLDQWIAHRRHAAAVYTAMLADVPMVRTPVEAVSGTHIYHQYTLKVPPETRDSLRMALKEAGVESMVYYPRPLHLQPAYRRACSVDKKMTNALTLSESVLSVPMHGNITEDDQRIVIEVIRNFYNK